MKNIRLLIHENFHFLVVKFSVYLNRHVFVMFEQIYLYIITHTNALEDIFKHICFIIVFCITFFSVTSRRWVGSGLRLNDDCSLNLCITKTHLFKYIENFTTKNWKFADKNSDIFHTSAQNIDCGYSLEPPRRGGSNGNPQSMLWAEIRKIMYTPVNPSFTI